MDSGLARFARPGMTDGCARAAVTPAALSVVIPGPERSEGARIHNHRLGLYSGSRLRRAPEWRGVAPPDMTEPLVQRGRKMR